MGYLLAGLLTGAGKGFTEIAAQRREDALLKLKRQYQKEDIDTEQRNLIAQEERAEGRAVAKDARTETAAVNAFDREYGAKISLAALKQQYAQEDAETDFQYEQRLLGIKADLESRHIRERGGEDRKTAQTKGQIDRSLEAFRHGNDREMAEIEAAIEGDKVHSTEVAADGSLVVMFKDGRKVRLKEKMQTSSSGEESGGGGTIAAARAARGGGAPAPAASASAPARSSPAAPKLDVADQEIQALWSALGAQPAPKPGEPKVRVIRGPEGKRVQVKWTGERWQPEKMIGG